MACGANYAWANRQLLMHRTREIFEKTLRISPRELGMRLVYDVCHNIAKIEEFSIQGKMKKLCVHRKGATRAFPADMMRCPRAIKVSASRCLSRVIWDAALMFWLVRKKRWKRLSAAPVMEREG